MNTSNSILFLFLIALLQCLKSRPVLRFLFFTKFPSCFLTVQLNIPSFLVFLFSHPFLWKLLRQIFSRKLGFLQRQIKRRSNHELSRSGGWTAICVEAKHDQRKARRFASCGFWHFPNQHRRLHLPATRQYPWHS